MTRLDRSQREFLAEASEIVDALQAGLGGIDGERKKGRAHPTRLNELFRHAHSLKGLAGMFGLDAISRLAHQMETLLDGLRLGRLELDDRLMEVLYACADAFTRLLGETKEGRTPDPEGVLVLIERIEQATQAGAQAGQRNLKSLSLPREALSALTEYEEHRLAENLQSDIPLYRVHAPLELASFEKELNALTAALTERGEVITTLPSTDDSGTRIIFDVVFASPLPAGDLQSAIAALGAYTIDRIDLEVAPAPATTQLPQPADPIEDEAIPGGTLRQIADTVRVDIKKLDELMGIVGELVLARGGLSRITSELKAEVGYRGIALDLHRLVRTLERRIADLQLAIMQVRMVPLGQVFERMARIIRRTATQLGKEVDLVMLGEETELDKLIVEDLVDPLMHLVRNAIDHGIEHKDARLAAGKPAQGKLEMRAYPRGNHVIIDVTDDGRGIDEFAVKRTALERGLVSEELVGQLSKRDVWNLIFVPGFSTRKEVTDTSGRGVGLDVVKTNISRLSGLIDVDSTPGKGTRFTITLPITLAIIQALIIKSANRVYALPLASVLEIVNVTGADLCRIEGKEMLQLRGTTLPVLRLDRVFHPSEARPAYKVPPAPRPGQAVDKNERVVDAKDVPIGFAAVVGLAQHRVALLVDDVVGQQDIVIKSLGAYLARVKGVAGATHLGDHETILVLDVAALVQELLSKEEPRLRGRIDMGEPTARSPGAG